VASSNPGHVRETAPTLTKEPSADAIFWSTWNNFHLTSDQTGPSQAGERNREIGCQFFGRGKREREAPRTRRRIPRT
jgi:hypothetical protein